MKIKTFVLSAMLLPMALFSQDKRKTDSIPAINLDAEAYRRMFSDERQRQELVNSTLVVYDGKLYPLSDFYLNDEERKKNIKSIKLIKEPDSVNAILSERIKTVIVIERKPTAED